MSRTGREDVPNVRELSGRPTGSMGVVGRFYMEIREWLGGTPRCPEVVGRLSVMSWSSWEDLPDVREWSGGPPRSPGVVGRSSRKFGNSREDLPDNREWLGEHP